MTGSWLMDWALVALSLFNTIVLLWLGLTVLLNAERRSPGVWLMGCGLLAGATFFVSHTATLGHELTLLTRGSDFWWQVGWVPIVIAPLAWYVMILWYAGFWSSRRIPVYRDHRPWLILTSITCLLLVALLLYRGLPSFAQATQLQLAAWPAIGGTALIFFLYPAYMVACFLLAVNALRHPAPPGRLMGDLARQRTRPWLIGAAAVLLIVSFLVTAFVLWAAGSVRSSAVSLLPAALVGSAAWFDLGSASLIAVAVLLIGQGIVAYEVFTGHTLPRRGFFRQWRSAVILAAGYGVVIGGSITFGLRSIYVLLLTTILMVTFYALFGWRSFVERERFMAYLRPFVGSQRLVESLLESPGHALATAEAIFQALCRDVLNAQRAQLVALGPLARLVGWSLQYPPSAATQSPPVLPPNLSASAEDRLVALVEPSFGPYQWAVPLWTERGLVGAILLGEKPGHGPYTEEEIDIARATGERVVDMLAGEEVAHRLLELQRQRLAATQVVDRRTRRALHDEILPELHTAVLRLSALPSSGGAASEAIGALMALHHQLADLVHDLPGAPSAAPSGDLVAALRHMVESEFAAEFDGVCWHTTEKPEPLLPLVQETVYYAVREAVRNAARHGRGADARRSLHLDIAIAVGERLVIVIADDGVGLVNDRDPAEPGDGLLPAGAQGGLALHSTLIAIIGGRLTVDSAAGRGTRVTVELGFSSLTGNQGQ